MNDNTNNHSENDSTHDLTNEISKIKGRDTQSQDSEIPVEEKTPLTEADAVEADAVEADAVEADAVEADAVEADAVEADAVEADAVEADAVEADAVEADAVEADASTRNPRPPKPTPLAVLLDNIPDALTQLDHWVMWDYRWKEGREGKKGYWNKPLFRVHGVGHAESNEPSTWASFVDAARTYEGGQYAGIGFVVAKGDGVVAVDLDKVRDAQTGELSADAQSIIRLLDTYTEISPSGTGLRLFLKGELPAGGRAVKQPHGAKYEIYDDRKYLTLTGQRIEETPAIVKDRSEALKVFLKRYFSARHKTKTGAIPSANHRDRSHPSTWGDDKLIEKILASKQGQLFQELWDGKLNSCDNDHSAGDWMFCKIVAFWSCKDAQRMDRLYRKSGLMRPKWDEARSNGDTTYGQQTITKAIDRCSAVYDPMIPDFPQRKAEDIPAPAGLDKNGHPVYSTHQMVHILYPQWEVSALTTHSAHALRLREYLGDDLRFTPQLGWLHFNGRSWEADDKDATRTAAIAASLSKQVRAEATYFYELAAILSAAGREMDTIAMSNAARGHGFHAQKVEDRKFVVDTLHLAAGQDSVRTSAKDFDPKAWVLGFENGVWDHGVWREHRMEDYFLHLCPIQVDIDAKSRQITASSNAETAIPSEWEGILHRISGGDKDLECTLQEVAGYILSGASHLPIIPWAYGQRGTGKSTFAVLLQTVLGENSKTVVPSELRKNADRERFGVKLWNRRLVVCSEAGHQQLDPELLKTLSGSDIFSVRYLFKEAFDAKPHHVLMLLSNDSPRLDAYDEPLKERILAMPFVVRLDGQGPLPLTGGERIEEVRKNPDSPLVREFALWAIQGMERVRLNGDVFRAPIVATANEVFWRDTDPLTEFWATIPVELLHRGIPKKELRDRYTYWCEIEGNGMRPFTSRPWTRACESMGLVEVRLTKDNIRAWKLPKQSGHSPENANVANPATQTTTAENPAEQKPKNLNIFGEEIDGDAINYAARNMGGRADMYDVNDLL